jgi:hypothetical protein
MGRQEQSKDQVSTIMNEGASAKPKGHRKQREWCFLEECRAVCTNATEEWNEMKTEGCPLNQAMRT